MDITINRRKGYMEATVPGDAQDARVFWHYKNGGFGLKFKCSDGRWYSQWLMWSCRGGRSAYYLPMIALYRALRREGIVPAKMLKKLAH